SRRVFAPGVRADPAALSRTSAPLVQRRVAALPGAPAARLSPAGAHRPVRTGRRGRPPRCLPDGVRLTQTSKHRDERGRLRRVETWATCGAPIEQSALVQVERRTGVCRDRLNALTLNALTLNALTLNALTLNA